jgi:putative addiction module antidote
MDEMRIKVRRSGNSLSIRLRKEVAGRLRVQVGDMLTLVPTDAGLESTAYDPDCEAELAIAEEGML